MRDGMASGPIGVRITITINVMLIMVLIMMLIIFHILKLHYMIMSHIVSSYLYASLPGHGSIRLPSSARG